MGTIAWGRVILGGLVAGVLWFIFEGVVQSLVLGHEWRDALIAVGRTNEQIDAGNGRFAMSVIIWCFAAGILGVWLYAAIRPRFGAGPKTATIAGLATWALTYLLPTLVDYAFGLWPTKLLVLPLTSAFFESIVATNAGAWIYKEP
jgi:hypothetical protein